jgi:hypothetical protein
VTITAKNILLEPQMPGQYSQDRIKRTGQPGEYCHDRTARIGHQLEKMFTDNEHTARRFFIGRQLKKR